MFAQQKEKTMLKGQIQIDQTWISKANSSEMIIDPELLQCMVCYGIPLGEYAQCEGCKRIFCQRDYQEVASTLGTCPNCKKAPFKKEKQPHILYRTIFDRIRFQCQLCHEKQADHHEDNKQQMMGQNKPRFKKRASQFVKKYTKHELYIHIDQHHKAKIMDFNVLYDFQVVFDKQTPKIVLDFYQNMQINHKLSQFQNKKKTAQKKVPYQLDNGHLIIIDLQTQLVSSPTYQKTGKLLKKTSQQLKKGIQYEVWQILLDIDYRYYSQYVQKMIKKQYEQFKLNKKKNQFTIDIGQQRYRISFKKMKQINTYSEFQRDIRRSVVKFM